MHGFVRSVFEFVLRDVFSGEVAEGGVGVLGGVLVLPWFVGFVVLLPEDALELVFA